MINYADYSFYSTTYKGSLSEDLFNSLILKASREIDTYVNREIKEDDLSNTENNFGYKIKYTTCLMLDYLKTETKTNGAVSHISIDGVSKTMKTLEDKENDKKKIVENLPHELTRYL